jgi:hypothetical protein
MEKVSLDFIDANTAEEYFNIFIKEIVSVKFSLYGHDVKVHKEAFWHACFELEKGGINKTKFSKRRAQKMLIIKQILQGYVPHICIWQQERNRPTLLIFSEIAEFYFILLPVEGKSRTYFQFITMVSLGEGIGKTVKKIKDKSIIIKNKEELQEVLSTKNTH